MCGEFGLGFLASEGGQNRLVGQDGLGRQLNLCGLEGLRSRHRLRRQQRLGRQVALRGQDRLCGQCCSGGIDCIIYCPSNVVRSRNSGRQSSVAGPRSPCVRSRGYCGVARHRRMDHLAGAVVCATWY